MDDNRISFTAGGDIPRGAACKISSGTTVVVTTAATERVVGFAEDTYASGDTVVLNTTPGRQRVLMNGSGTAIAAGDPLSPGASGKLVKYAGTSTHRIVATASEACAADGELHYCNFDPVTQYPAP